MWRLPGYMIQSPGFDFCNLHLLPASLSLQSAKPLIRPRTPSLGDKPHMGSGIRWWSILLHVASHEILTYLFSLSPRGDLFFLLVPSKTETTDASANMQNQRYLGEHGEAVEMSPQSHPNASGVAFAGNKETPSVEANSLEDANKHVSVTHSTPDDDAGMRRMGKEQQLVRHFRQLSVTSFTALSVAAWELGLFLLSPALINGGRAGLIWGTLWISIGFGPVYISMAEMVSMASTAGAQYHWVSEFAPDNCQRILSYITGFVYSSCRDQWA